LGGDPVAANGAPCRALQSPDKKWVVQLLPDRLNLIPVGPGESKTIQDKEFQYRWAKWFPDSKRLFISATTPGHGPRLFVRDASGGASRPMTPEGTVGGQLSYDGKTILAADRKSGKWALYPVDGGEPRPVSGIRDDDDVLGFDEKGESVHLATRGLSVRIERLDLANSKRTLFREITPADPTGVASLAALQLTPDGKSYCYSLMRSLSRLYVVEGLK
jgi:hypothetical protein